MEGSEFVALGLHLYGGRLLVELACEEGLYDTGTNANVPGLGKARDGFGVKPCVVRNPPLILMPDVRREDEVAGYDIPRDHHPVLHNLEAELGILEALQGAQLDQAIVSPQELRQLA